MKRTNLFLFFIILIATFLRFWQIGAVPASPDWDEVSLGYNAYSLMQTGRDEYGKLLPFIFRSYEDFKPPLYAYLAIPSIAVFGLTTIAVRLPAVLFGILAVLGMYLLVKELFKPLSFRTHSSGEKSQKDSIFGGDLSFVEMTEYVALLSSLLLAISPWHIQLSRVAFESSTALTVIIFASLFFLKGLKKPWLISLSVALFSATIYLYQSQKVFAPVLLIALVLLYRKELFSLPKKYIITPLLIGAIIVLPIVAYTITRQQALSRATSTSIFSHELNPEYNSTIRLQLDKQNNDESGYLFDNKLLAYKKEMLNGYLAHFDLNWLFIRGDMERHHAPGMGLLYLWELPFLLIGLYQLFFHEKRKKEKLLVFSWLLLAPIPASLTVETPHAVRTLQMLPMIEILVAVGLVTAYRVIKSSSHQVFTSKVIKLFILLLFIFVLLFNFMYYLNQYFVQQNYFYGRSWQYGYAQTIPAVQKLAEDNDKIVVSNQKYLDQSYMFFLFYTKYPPQKYQAENKLYGITAPYKVMGKYEFRPIDWNTDGKLRKTLFVGNADDFPASITPTMVITSPDGKAVIKVVESMRE